MAGRPFVVYGNNKEGDTTARAYWRCPRGHGKPTPCIGCDAQRSECEVAELFKDTIKEPGYEKL